MHRLDRDFCSLGLDDVGALNNDQDLSMAVVRIAQSGAVGVFGLIDWTFSSADGSVELQIANVGDCLAVLFSSYDEPDATDTTKTEGRKTKKSRRGGLHRHNRRSDPSERQAHKCELKPLCLAKPHNCCVNKDEHLRLITEHPDNEAGDLIRNGGRLLGELAPTRAFGDVRYKWPASQLKKLSEYLVQSGKIDAGMWTGFESPPTPYTSPPYLTAKPEVFKYVVKPNDRYLVLATDGLWDTLTPELAASLLSRLQPGQCPATRLMRAALSIPVVAEGGDGGDGGASNAKPKEDSRLASALLSMPPGVARLYRDDITLVVVEFTDAKNAATTSPNATSDTISVQNPPPP